MLFDACKPHIEPTDSAKPPRSLLSALICLVIWIRIKMHRHKPVHDHEFDFPGNGMPVKGCEAHCSICGAEMFGTYQKGEMSGEWFWVYVKVGR